MPQRRARNRQTEPVSVIQISHTTGKNIQQQSIQITDMKVQFTQTQKLFFFLSVFYSINPSEEKPPANQKSSGIPLWKVSHRAPVKHRDITSSTYALETWTSCQLLDRFCFSPSKGVRPSFLFSSPQCLSLAARTCLRVPISSSTLERGRGLA